jgi:glycosyltransferase involved in cell wall biosynthesis
MFKIIVVGGPAENYVERCLQSVLRQPEYFQAQVVLDPVGDRTYEQAKKYECDRIKVCLNDQRMYAFPNIIKCIALLKPSDEDVLVTLDADDWFYSEQVLSILTGYYKENPQLLVTYGSWVSYPDASRPTNCRPYTEQDFQSTLRHKDWRGTHLRTMKYKVWKHIRDDAFRGNNGAYLKTAWDIAFMLPALEMAGYHRSKYIQDKMYVYNQEIATNDYKIHAEESIRDAECVMNKPAYQYLENF